MASEYRFLLPPEFHISADDIAQAWAGDPEAAALGTLEPEPSTRESFDFDLASAATGALIVMASTLSKDLIVELVKRAIDRAEERQGKSKNTEIRVKQVPDAKTGLPLFFIKKSNSE